MQWLDDSPGPGNGLGVRLAAARMNFAWNVENPPRRFHFACVIILALLLLGSLSAATAAVASQAGEGGGPASSVDPFVGTGHGPTNHINIISGNENLFPGASLPFGMVQLSPDTEDYGTGYHYFQPEIHGFSMTHMSGAGCRYEGDVFFTPTAGPVETGMSQFASPYSHSQESASPGYYRVQLLRSGINAELTATDRTGLARFTFPAGKTANILVPITHTLNYTTAAHVQVVGDNQITGYVEDPLPFYEDASMMIVPLRAGGGMRVKILNALSQGIPMVSTTIGCEGIQVTHEQDILLADEAADFADACTRLLTDYDLNERLARNGRQTAEQRYDYRQVCRALDDVYAIQRV